jgi:SH3-like domain-containing protein
MIHPIADPYIRRLRVIIAVAALAMVLIAGVLATLAIAPAAHAADQRPPYWASINRPRAIMRAGPASEMRALWEYRRMGLPVRVLAVRDDWRRVEDPDGVVGWMHKRLLTGRRTAIVTGTAAQAMRSSPAVDAPVAWRAEPGVVGRLSDCANGWCRLDVDGQRGWVSVDSIWGD